MPVLIWFAVQLWKVISSLIFHRKLDLSLLWATGGMPSSHSALVVALAITVGIETGFDSPLFAVSAVLGDDRDVRRGRRPPGRGQAGGRRSI